MIKYHDISAGKAGISISLGLMLAAAVLMLAAGSLSAQESIKTSTGNNINFTINPDSGPWFNQPKTQWPKGSGHFYGGAANYVRAGITAGAARDLDGNGTFEDTVFSTQRHREISGWVSTPGQQENIETWYANGNFMGDVTGQTQYNRAYSSNIAADVDDWPEEFRDKDGKMVTRGDETIVVRMSDTFNEEMRAGTAPLGISLEIAHYFLNFGANKDIVYCEMKVQNMSEFLVYNDNQDYVAVSPAGGTTWNGLIFGHSGYRVGAGVRDEAFGVLTSENMSAIFDRDGTESWGTDVGLIGFRYLRFPEFGTQTMKQIAAATGYSTGFGTSDPNQDPMDYGEDFTQYRWCADLQVNPDQVNPYNADGVMRSWPGVAKDPSEEYWDQWRWARHPTDYIHTLGSLDGFAPRDTTSLALAIFFAYPTVTPMSWDDNNLETKSMDAVMSPLIELGQFAQDSYDAGLQTPQPPVVPTLTIIPGDRQVTLTWSDVSITTPDPYYDVLQDRGWDPMGNYVEYDFAGFKLYRNYTGPGDSYHEEMIGQWEYPNVPFSYVDNWDKEIQQFRSDPRLKNGFRVWYALVPYDSNVLLDGEGNVTGEFSLESGKIWNSNIQDYYQVVPRSNASEFKPGSQGLMGQMFPSGVSPDAASNALESIDVSIINEDRLIANPSDTLFYIVIDSVKAQNLLWDATSLYFIHMEDRVGSVLSASSGVGNNEGWVTQAVFSDGGNSMLPSAVPLYSKVTSQGIDLTASFILNMTNLADGANFDPWIGDPVGKDFYSATLVGAPANVELDPKVVGGTDWNPDNEDEDWSWVDWTSPNRLAVYSFPQFLRCGDIQITWVDQGDNVTINAQDVTNGVAVPFSDDPGMSWGFIDDFSSFQGERWDNSPNSLSSSTSKANFNEGSEALIFMGGHIIQVQGDGTVPSGSFTLSSDCNPVNGVRPAVPGNRYMFSVTPGSMNPNDADLEAIRVVPNPYIATSAMDNSPSQRRIEFINLPSRCTIRIYSLGGNLVQVLNHIGDNRFGWGQYRNRDREQTVDEKWVDSGWDRHSGTEPWNMRNRFGTTVASGLYFYHVTDQVGNEHIGRFYIVN